MPVTMSDTEKMSQVSTSSTGSPRDLSTAALVKEIGAGVGIWQWGVHVRQRDSWLSRAQRLSLAARRTIKAPDDVAKTSPSVAKKIATAVAVAAAGMVTRRLLSRYLAQFTHAHTERMGSLSGHLNPDQTARASKRA